MKQWTDNQELAIKERNCNLLLAAGAGTGKTAVLVERVIQLILKDLLNIDEFLIVTFTNAAAAEMRQRIQTALITELESKQDDTSHIRKQLNALSSASISTIHSFCLEVVRKYFFLLDLDPNFRIADVNEISVIKKEVIREIIEAQYESEESIFQDLVESYGNSIDDEPLQDLIIKIYNFIQSKPDSLNWLEEIIKEYTLSADELSKSAWVLAIKEDLESELLGIRGLFAETYKMIEQNKELEGYKEAIIYDLNSIDILQENLEQGIEEFFKALLQLEHLRLGRIPKDTDPNLKESFIKLRDEGKNSLKNIRKTLLIKSPQDFASDLNELHPIMKHLYILVEKFKEAYQNIKKEKGIIDFNDLEHFTLDLLKHEKVREELAKKYAYVFVDEYQDSNLVQENIINQIKRVNNLFLVGDVKQSIYRFRLADPSLFLSKYNLYESDGQSSNKRINLSINFRSKNNILNGINYIFKHLMSQKFGEIDYCEEVYLYPGTPDSIEENQRLSNELIIIENTKSSDDGEELSNIELESKLLVEKIREITSGANSASPADISKKYEYRDIVILLRASKSQIDIITDTLEDNGIPVYADVNEGFFEAIEIAILLNLLRLIDNKRQDVPLLSVLRSPILQFSAEELVEIRHYAKKLSFIDAVEAYINANDNSLKDRLEDFLLQLKVWQDEARFLALDELIWKIISETGFYYYLGAMPGGQQRQANIRILLERAREFQKTSFKGLFSFLQMLEKIQNSSGDMGTAKILGENNKVVRIMSIHKSKGLEFPVVFILGLGKQFNFSDTTASVLLHKDLGIGSKYINIKNRTYTDSIATIAIKNRIKKENLAEEMRILYVATTRAQEKLVLIGCVKNIENKAKKWMLKLSPYRLAQARNYLDWIGAILMRHPDGGAIRQASNFALEDDFLFEDKSEWNINIMAKESIVEQERNIIAKQLAIKEYLQNFRLEQKSEYSDEINARLDWKYPYQEAVLLPSKLSVTQTSRLKTDANECIETHIPSLQESPLFIMGDEKLSGQKRGNMMHLVMHHLDFNSIKAEEINKQMQDWVKKEIISDEDLKYVDVTQILHFFNTKLGKRILEAELVWRETPFNLLCEASEIIQGMSLSEQNLLVQGVIDLHFEEGDEIILLDYKTDSFPIEKLSEKAEQYKGQLDLYSKALERILGKKVREKYIYFFNLGKEVKIS